MNTKKVTIEVSTHKFEVYPRDALPSFEYNEALEYCKRLGDGWRLPELNEQSEMHEHKEELGLDDGAYWSSTELNSSYAWFYNFLYGISDYFNKTSTFSVRAVRTI